MRATPAAGEEIRVSSAESRRTVVSMLRATFPKQKGRGALAVFAWRDGTSATTPTDSGERLPHDLTHYAVEAHFRPPYGFWSLAARQAPFESLTLVAGRWPAAGRSALERARRKHGAEMLKAEAVNLTMLADPEFDLARGWGALRKTLTRAYAFGPSNVFADASRADFDAVRTRYLDLTRAWSKVPYGGGLVLSWPPDRVPVVCRDLADLASASSGALRRKER